VISFCDWASRRSPRHVSILRSFNSFWGLLPGVIPLLRAWVLSIHFRVGRILSFPFGSEDLLGSLPTDLTVPSCELPARSDRWASIPPRPVDCWVETTAPIIVFNYPSIHQVYSDSESFLDAHSIYIIGPASVDPCSMGAPQQTHASKPSTDDNSWSTIAFSKF